MILKVLVLILEVLVLRIFMLWILRLLVVWKILAVLISNCRNLGSCPKVQHLAPLAPKCEVIEGRGLNNFGGCLKSGNWPTLRILLCKGIGRSCCSQNWSWCGGWRNLVTKSSHHIGDSFHQIGLGMPYFLEGSGQGMRNFQGKFSVGFCHN